METDGAFAEIFSLKPDWLGKLAGWEHSDGPFLETRPGTFKAVLHCDLLVVPADPVEAEKVCELQLYYDRAVWVRTDLARLLRWRQINPPEACRSRGFTPRRVEGFIVFGDRSHVPPGDEEAPHIRWVILSERLAELEAVEPGHALAALLRPVVAASDAEVEARAASDYRMLHDHPEMSGTDRDCLVRIFVRFLMQRFRTRTLEQINHMIEELVQVEETRAGRELIEKGIERGIEKGMERGVEEGLERGLEQGIHRGIDEVIVALLDRICGGLDDIRRTRVEDLPVAKAKELALALLDFRGVADLDAWLAANG